MQLAGANATEEIEQVLIHLTEQLAQFEQQHGPFQLTALFNPPDANRLGVQPLRPPFEQFSSAAPTGIKPRINLPPTELLLDLGEHYLLASLQLILSQSLLAENQQRISHLQRNVNRMRQEAIIEEIEIILINQSNPAFGIGE